MARMGTEQGVDSIACPREAGWWRRVSIAPFVAAIKLYQFTLSPVLGRGCRFHPTCSWYALEAYREHGALRGTALTAWRLLRCNPFCRGGWDPVPPRHGGQAGGPKIVKR
jgi:putative membrane protein insertion efficiency factor